MRRLFPLLIILCMCKIEEKELLPVNKVESTQSVRLGEDTYLYLEGYLPSSCWEFEGYDITSSDTIIYIWPWIIKKDEICPETLIGFYDTLVFTFHSPGRYLFYVYTKDTFLTTTTEVWIK